ncbi:hypothetical protein P7K49_018238 [Saguinus oedipus]|uniref:Uncharacterized protein n=1 Tax=Saguinus oedipus TaxID=9490 RepID=A0ABQ9V5A8_SAGOE|nr:hypothetical protein P7K49_018238 [Saguinus oedipus]
MSPKKKLSLRQAAHGGLQTPGATQHPLTSAKALPNGCAKVAGQEIQFQEKIQEPWHAEGLPGEASGLHSQFMPPDYWVDGFLQTRFSQKRVFVTLGDKTGGDKVVIQPTVRVATPSLWVLALSLLPAR